jgi:hypothetical protein
VRVVANLADAAILQVEKTVPTGEARPFNGRYAVAIPEMAAVEVTPTSYVLPVDGGDVSSLAMAGLLVQYPMYSNVVFNPLLTASDMADLDLTAVFTPTGDISRAMIGRGAGPGPTGCSPNSVCILPLNAAVIPNRPGVLITDTITIAGAQEFMVWWHMVELDTTEDVTSSYGATNGLNTPSYRELTEADPEDAGFAVWISNDDGVTYTAINYLEPTDLGVLGTDLRLAFVNNTSARRFITAFAILF